MSGKKSKYKIGDQVRCNLVGLNHIKGAVVEVTASQKYEFVYKLDTTYIIFTQAELNKNE